MTAERVLTMGDRLLGECGNRSESFQSGLMKNDTFLVVFSIEK